MRAVEKAHEPSQHCTWASSDAPQSWVVPNRGLIMPPPAITPTERPVTEIPATSSYKPGDRVWVYRGGSWRPGVVESATSLAVLATYRPTGAGGTGVDTVTAPCVTRRTDTDTSLDQTERLNERLVAAVTRPIATKAAIPIACSSPAALSPVADTEPQ